MSTSYCGIDNQFEHSEILVFAGHVQRSGANVYYRPGNHDFTANNGKSYYTTYQEAYKSEDF
jgi:UDP-2,3-diacylglucosamine pyrophosphatase LpxH